MTTNSFLVVSIQELLLSVEKVDKWDLMFYSSKYISAIINLVQKKQANGTQFLVVSIEEVLFGVEKVGKWDQMFLQV